MSVDPNERLVAIDVLRGVAVLGILVMNLGSSAMPLGAYFSPDLYYANEGLNRLIFQIQFVVFSNKMMPIFGMLFGAGVILFATKVDRGEPVERVRAVWLRRCAWLLFFGLIHAYLIWEGDILVPYAISGLIAVWWLRRLAPGWLALIGACAMIFGAIINALFSLFLLVALDPELRAEFGHSLPPGYVEQMIQDMGWLGLTTEQIQSIVATMRSDYVTIFLDRLPRLLEQHLIFLPFMFIWVIIGVMLVGMALMKWGVLTGRRSSRFCIGLMIAGYGIGVPLSLLALQIGDATSWNPGWIFVGVVSVNVFAGPITALGHIGLVMLLVKRDALGWLGTCLQAAGRMAFTNYITQSLIMTFVFYGYGLGLYGSVDRLGQMVFVLGVWLLQLAWSPLWLAHFKYGPLEWLWRCLTYWKMMPISRASAG